MDKLERAKMVLAMETVIRNINDENIFMRWLTIGVADGDINDDTTPEEVDEYYLEDDNFAELMGSFLIIISSCKVDDGLYCDGICSKDLD